MARPKSKKIVTPAARRLRHAVGTNLKRLILEEWPSKSLTYGYKRIGEATGFSLSTMQRIADGRNACELDTLADVAKALGRTAAELCYQGVPTEPEPRRRLHDPQQTD